jgi:hypothetical protein
VHLPRYGVQDVADPNNMTCFTYNMDPSCDAATAVKNAFLASTKYGDGGVTTDGRSIAILSQCGGCVDSASGIEIPEDQYLTCAGPPGARRGWGPTAPGRDPNVFSSAPASIVLDPDFTITRKKNTRLSNCFIRPKWLYAGTHDGLTLPPTNVGELVQMTHQYTGTATTCGNDGCNMDHMLIAGFDICDDSSDANLAVLSDLIEDCPTGEWMHGGGGAGPKLRNITSDPVLEGSLDPLIQSLCYPIVGLTQNGATDGVIVRVETNYAASAGCGLGTTSIGDQLQSSGDTVLIAGLGLSAPAGSPVSAGGRWLTSSVTQVGSSSQYDVLLIGASWAGPTVSGSAWKAGASVITVGDNTNIIPGQYVCASGTPPLCTPPSDFGFSSTTLSAGISAGANIVAQVGSTAHWPVNGLAEVGFEFVSYTVQDATHILLTNRGQHGTTATTHGLSTAVTAAAPIVLSVPPPVVAAGPAVPGTYSEAVIVSAPAQNDGSGTVTFANDTTLWLQSGTTSYGLLYLDPSYRAWTANQHAGGRPSSLVTDLANGSATATTITGFKDCWKAQPGMLVTDVTVSGHVADNTLVDHCSGTTLTINQALAGSFTGDLIELSGCGYPGLLPDTGTPMPWLGNCAATALLLGGSEPGKSGDEVQGTFCDTIKSASIEIAIHSLDAPATVCANFIADTVTDDPDSAALWLDGKATKSEYSNGRLAGGFNSILDTPSDGQSDGVGISNVQTASNIALGTGSNVTLIAPHGQTNAPAPSVFVSSGATLAQIAGANLPQWTVASDSTAGLAALSCSANVFATAPCGQVKTAPTCLSGCSGAGSSVTGNDSSFAVNSGTGGLATTVTVQLAGQYAVAPICTVSAGVPPLVAPPSALL